MSDFVHLHVHSEYSLLDGVCRIKGLVKRAAELGQSAVAITDHGVMYGVIDFYTAAKAEGIKPIIGCEVYVAPRTRFDRVHEFDSEARHLVLLCINETGYKNLCYMVSKAYTEGFYIKPRVDLELLRERSGGLIACSACLAGEVPKQLVARNYEGAKKAALELRDIFGADNFYLELQKHGVPEQDEANAGLIKLSRETDIPLIVSNDAHYLTKADAYIQDVLMCIQTNKTVDDTDRMMLRPDEFYVKSSEEMAALFPELPEALENTVKIAERCNLDFEFGNLHLPEFSPPEGYTKYDYFTKLCEDGFKVRFPQGGDEHLKRLKFEMEMIEKMGFTEYFLIVSDFISYAKRNGIAVGPGRGSAAGSIVSYCLFITDVDPIKYNLYFERFLNPERVSMPDIDIDFCYIRRQEVIDYVIEKYGAEHVAQIATFGTMAARGAIRDVARALNITYAEADTVAKLVPFQLNMTLDEALKVSKPLRDMYEGSDTIRHLINTAKALEGMPRHSSTHAAGVVITREPVYEYVPLAKNDEAVVTQYPMGALERLGLLKMDFLGLRNLTVMEHAVKMIKKSGVGFSLGDIDDGDAETLAMLTEGRTLGVFQLESAGMTSVCVRLKPQGIEDLTAIVALYRPGPMESIPRFIESKHNPGKVTYRHPKLKEILDVTYGCIVYQEQVLEIFRKLGGFSLGQADMVRRAISKKKLEELRRERERFIYGSEADNIPGAIKNDVDEKTAGAIYEEILDFANYAFNKAHAVCYGIIAYQTAYLKRHFPKEYMAALLTSVLDSSSKIAEYIAECRDLGINVLPPDINESDDEFTVAGENIRFGLVAVKNIGRGFIKQLMAERGKSGDYTSFLDFCERMYGFDLNRRAMESLIKCGALDRFGHKRSQMLAVFEKILGGIGESRVRNLDGQIDLFGGSEKQTEVLMPDIPELPQSELLTMEREITGLYLSGHPMDTYKNLIKKSGAVMIGRIISDFAQESGATVFKDEQQITLAGIISSVKTKTTRNNTLMAYVTLEDSTGLIELLAFERTLNLGGGYIKAGAAVLVRGRISARDEKEPQILCESIRPLSDVNSPDEREINDNEVKKLYIRLPSEEDPRFGKIKAILSMFPGEARAVIYFEDSGSRKGAYYKYAEALIAELKEVLGAENVIIK